MTPYILEWLLLCRRFITTPGRVLEVGSLDVNGSPRDRFSDATSYVGIDTSAGPGVDLVMDAGDAPQIFGTDWFDVVVCCEVLEHVRSPLDVADAMRSVLRHGGWMIVTSPLNGFPEHRHPRDYWRLMPDCYEELIFSGFEITDKALVGRGRRDSAMCYLGRKL